MSEETGRKILAEIRSLRNLIVILFLVAAVAYKWLG